MFYEGEIVRTCQAVTKETRDILVAKGIKPGTKGVVISETTFITVNFDGQIITLKEDALELDKKYENKNEYESDMLKSVKDMFGGAFK